jgi:hypothetical protein
MDADEGGYTQIPLEFDTFVPAFFLSSSVFIGGLVPGVPPWWPSSRHWRMMRGRGYFFLAAEHSSKHESEHCPEHR